MKQTSATELDSERKKHSAELEAERQKHLSELNYERESRRKAWEAVEGARVERDEARTMCRDCPGVALMQEGKKNKNP